MGHAKRASLAAEAATLRKQQTLQEEELRLKHEVLKYQQQQEEANLRLEQRKQQLQLEIQIAELDVEEQVYATAEQGDQYVELPSYALDCISHILRLYLTTGNVCFILQIISIFPFCKLQKTEYINT